MTLDLIRFLYGIVFNSLRKEVNVANGRVITTCKTSAIEKEKLLFFILLAFLLVERTFKSKIVIFALLYSSFNLFHFHVYFFYWYGKLMIEQKRKCEEGHSSSLSSYSNCRSMGHYHWDRIDPQDNENKV